MRIGWVYGRRRVIDALNRIRGPFNVSAPAIAAGVAALDDAAHHRDARARTTRMAALAHARSSTKLGLEVTPSVGNFVLIHFPSDPAKSAEKADAFLTARGLMLRACRRPTACRNALRMTIGTEEANRLVVAALADFMAQSVTHLFESRRA